MDKKEKRIVVGLCLGIVVCLVAVICLIVIMYMPNVYEGNYMKLAYKKGMNITSREQKNCTNVTVSDEEGNMVVCSVAIQSKDLEADLFFDSIEDTFSGRKEMEMVDLEKGKSNDGKGSKVYKEYEILDIDNNEYKALAQLQSLEDDYYIFSLAYIEEDFEENEKLAKITMDSVEYSDIKNAGELALTEHFSPLFEIHRFLIMNEEKDTSIETADLQKKSEEYKESLPADLTLKDVEGYEYLKKIDIASADGNVYEIMVPKNYEAEGEKRFVTYYGDGFMLSMYARELFEEESLADFLEVNNDFLYEDPEKDYTNVETTEMIEENGLIYQICRAYSVDYEGKSKPHAELVAAIPLGGTDVLSFSLRYEEFVMSEDFEAYLEELERYYKVPVMQFAELTENNEIEGEVNYEIIDKLTFEVLSQYSYHFSSGAGGWGEEFIIECDGYFKGKYHDSDMGSNADAYPNGTVYSSNYSGYFENLKKIDEYSYEMTMREIQYKEVPGTEEIEGGVRYIYSDAYCLGGNDTFKVYLPGTPLDLLSEEVLSWIHYYNDSDTVLTMLIIVDEENGYGICSTERLSAVEDAAMYYSSYKESYDYYTRLAAETTSTAEMVDNAKRRYEVADDCLNYLWDIIRYCLDEEAFMKLQSEQREWVSQKEEQAQANADEWGGGSGAPVVYYDILADLTMQRCGELLEYIK